MDLSLEQWPLYASFLLFGIVAGYKIKVPLNRLRALTLNERLKLVLVVRKDLEMGRGKIISQCCHGTLSAYITGLKERPKLIEQWLSVGQPKVILKANDLQELKKIQQNATAKGIMTTIIRDAGRTQIASGTETVLAVGPDAISKVDEVTGHLKLL